MKRSDLISQFIALFFLLLASPSLFADVIVFKNGDRITGDITLIWDDKLTIEPDYSDAFEVDMDVITSIETDEPMTIELYDGREGDYTFAGAGEDGKLLVQTSSGLIPLEYFNLKRVEEVDKAFDWEARADLSQSLTSGNTTSRATNINASLEFNVEDRRHLYELDALVEKVEEVETQNNSTLNYTFNWIFNDPWFLAANATYEQDQIALIDYRFSGNPALGYDIWDEPSRTFNVQFGPGYQIEKIEGEEQKSTVAAWRLRFMHKLLSDDFEFYHNHSLYQNFGGRDNLVFNSTTGIRYEFTDDIYMNTELKYDSDSDPASGTSSENATFLIGAGVKFE